MGPPVKCQVYRCQLPRGTGLHSTEPNLVESWVRSSVPYLPMPSFTVAGLPSSSDWLNVAVIVSDETGGRTIATFDGSAWKRVKDGATCS